jgi:uncharacterized protein YecT (DUF1311 family)
MGPGQFRRRALVHIGSEISPSTDAGRVDPAQLKGHKIAAERRNRPIPSYPDREPMSAERPKTRPNRLTVGMGAAVASLAVGGLIFAAVDVARDRGGQGRPTVLAVGRAMAVLRIEATAQQGQQQLGLRRQALVAALNDASDRHDQSVRALDGAWKALAPEKSQALTEAQQAWIGRKNAACAADADRASADPIDRETARQNCETGANWKRTLWVKEQAAAPASGAVLSAAEACDILHGGGRHIGETITFPGDYQTDRAAGLALILPVGCDRAAGVAGMDAGAKRLIGEADPPPWPLPHRRLLGVFTARLIQDAPDESVFDHDDGVRLEVAQIADLQVIQPTARAAAGR